MSSHRLDSSYKETGYHFLLSDAEKLAKNIDTVSLGFSSLLYNERGYHFVLSDAEKLAEFLIKAANSREEVKIRFYGKPYYREFEIPKNQQIAMAKVAQNYLKMLKSHK